MDFPLNATLAEAMSTRAMTDLRVTLALLRPSVAKIKGSVQIRRKRRVRAVLVQVVSFVVIQHRIATLVVNDHMRADVPMATLSITCQPHTQKVPATQTTKIDAEHVREGIG
eukprot:COSAG01_NODE_910_length_12784_cov_15.136460_4_plen_112_part_00